MIFFLKTLVSVLILACVFYGARFFCVSTQNKYRKKRRERLTSSLAKSFYLWTYKEHIPRKDFSLMLSCRKIKLICKILSQIKEISSSHIAMRFERYVAWKKIDVKLLKCARQTHAIQRALIIKTLYLLPLPRWSEKKVGLYTNDKNSYVRLFALLSKLDYDLANAYNILEEFKHDFRIIDYSMLAVFFQKHAASKTLHLKLLDSPNEQLQMLGLYIIKHSLNSEDCDKIQQKLPSDNHYINLEIIKTLIINHHSLNHSVIVDTISQMDSNTRKSIYRLASSEGYSLFGIEDVLLSEKHAYMVDYVVSLIQGGKYKLNKE